MHRPKTPTTCNKSDLLNSMVKFINDNPLWYEEQSSFARVGLAYSMLTKMADHDEFSDDEYDFIINTYNTLTEASK